MLKYNLAPYAGEFQIPAIQNLIGENLSEAYSIYVYRYFLHQWPHLCFTASIGSEICGIIICKAESKGSKCMRGYIAMLVVRSSEQGQGIATQLVLKAIQAMKEGTANEVVLETEVDNYAAQKLYENLGFMRYKRLHRYYLNNNDAFRFLLPLEYS